MRFTWMAGIAAFAAVLGLGAGAAWLRGALPQTEGVLAVPGLTAPVAILRDADGIPLIRAGSERDAYFALGFVHAQDRLWQMDFMRRAGGGRLAEILGADMLPQDRFMRTLGLRRRAERILARLGGAVRAALDAYAAGVNAYLDSHEGAWPPEFYLLRYRPAPWRPVDSLIWGQLMTLRLSGNWRTELLRARLLKRLTPRQVAELWPPYPEGSPKGVADGPAPDLGALYRRLPLAALWAALPETIGGYSASNNWVVAGPRTISGKPVLANDVHLPLEAPGVWYLARIEAPGLVLAGATAPGVPFLILGHNGRVAWGFTTTHSDTQDLFIERLAEGDPDSYMTPDGPRRFDVREEVIAVRGGEDVRVTLRESRHGPIISDVVAAAAEAAPTPGPRGEEGGGGPGYVLALADAALVGDNLAVKALYGINHARDTDSFVAALADFHAPQQNIVYADVGGTVGFIAPARVPVRRAGDGLSPVPGWSGAYDWTGFIPFAALPRTTNPGSGHIVTANHRIVTDAYPYLIAARWPAPYRARRILELLDRPAKHGTKDSAAIQRDAVSLAARDLLPTLLAVPVATAEAAAARDMLARWDGRMDRDRPEPLIYAAWLDALGRFIYADETGPLYESFPSPRPLFLAAVLTRQRHWCDDVTTAQAETCTDMIARALERALADLAASYGEGMAAWRWGDAHRASFPHPVLSRVPVLRDLFDLCIASDGDDNTVNRGTYRGGAAQPFTHIHGAGFRAVYDLADLDDSRFMIAPGQSGNPLSPHYRDLLERWRDGAYLPLAAPRDDAGPGGAPARRLVLRPAATGG